MFAIRITMTTSMAKLKSNIYLIGPMGVGKTTIGRQLAQTLKMTFCDSDHEVEASTGATISWIFDIEGEAGFRERERQAVEMLSKKTDIILATGGGVVVTPDNRRVLAATGTVVYLKASIESQMHRTRYGSERRPLLRDGNREVFEKLCEQRHPLYEEIADLTYDTDDISIRSVINNIIHDLEEQRLVQ